MTENNKSSENNDQVSGKQLTDVAGGNKIQQQRLEALDARDSSKRADNIIHKTRLINLDSRDSSK